MTQYVIFTAEHIIHLHEAVIRNQELQGIAKDKSLNAALERVHNRLRYGFISDAYDLAACYGAFLARGHCFNDANKRTAATAVFFSLSLNGIEVTFPDLSLAQWIIDLAAGKRDELELALWLRSLESL